MANITDVYKKVNDIDGKLDKILGAIQNGMGTNGGNGNNGSNDDEIKAKKKRNIDIADAIFSTINTAMDVFMKQYKIHLEKQKVNLQYATDSFLKQVDAFNTATGTIIASITSLDAKNMVSNSIQNLSDTLKASSEIFKNKLDQDLLLFNKETELRKLGIEQQKNYANGIGNVLKSVTSFIPGIGSAIAGGIADLGMNIANMEAEAREAQINLILIEQENIKKVQNGYIDMLTNYINQYSPFMKDNVTEIVKIEDESYALGRIFGYTGDNLSNFSDGIFKTNITMAELGKNWEDFLKIQRSYMDTTGRSIQLTGAEGLNISALAQWTGISDEESARLAGNMQIFNKGAMESTQNIFEMSQTAQSMGLSNQKFVKDLEKNLRLAQKYDFKNGTRGLQEMALFAQRTRMEMSQLDAILSGFHTGNIEDVITKAASLNVLGGNAALISDPLGMLYDAYANPKGMGERVLQSISGMGFFNQRTGETEFGIAERMRIEQIAKSLGMSPENLTEMARQENKGRELNRLYGEKAFGKYGERVKQQAYFENGEWKVNVMGEGGETQAMSLSAIQGNASLLEKIMPDTEQGQLLEVTKASLSAQAQIAVATESINSEIKDKAHSGVLETERTAMVEAIKRGRSLIDDFVIGIQEAASSAARIKDIFNSVGSIDTEAIKQGFRFAEFGAKEMLKLNENETFKEVVKWIGESNEMEEVMTKGHNKATEEVTIPLDLSNPRSVKRALRDKGIKVDEIRNYNDGTYSVLAHVGSGKNKVHYDSALTKYNENLIVKPVSGNGTNYVFKAAEKAEDAIITPSGKVVKPDAQDFKVLMKQGGDIQRMLSGSQSANSEAPRSINVSGSLFLNTDGQSVDLVELINKNPEAFYRVTNNILFPNQGQSRVNV